MHRNGHWEQEISHLPASPLSVQLSFFLLLIIFFLTEMHSSFASSFFFSHFPFPVFNFRGSWTFMSSCKQSLVWTLVCDSCSSLFLQEFSSFQQISLISSAETLPTARCSRARCSSLVTTFLWAEERSSVAIVQSEQATQVAVVMQFVAIVQSERATKAAAVVRFVVRWPVAHLGSVRGVITHFLRQSGWAVLWFVF